MIRLPLIPLLLFYLGLPNSGMSPWGLHPAQAQSAPGAAAPASTPTPTPAPSPAATPSAGDARRALDVLKDERRRAELIATLEAIAAAQASKPVVRSQAGGPPPATAPSTPPAPAPGPEPGVKPAEGDAPTGLALPLAPDSLGANLAIGAGELLDSMGTKLRDSVVLAGGLPWLAEWAWDMLADPGKRDLLLNTFWRLILGFVVGLIASYATARMLRRPRAALVRRAADPAADASIGLARAEHGETEAPPPASRTGWRDHPLLCRLPYALGCLGLDLLPVLAFLLTTHLVTATAAGGTLLMRLVLLAPLQGFALWRATLCVSAAVTAPKTPHLRLLPAGDDTAAYLHRQVRWLAGVVILGSAVTRVGWLLGLSLTAHAVLQKTILLVAHVGVGVIVLRQRKAVAAWLLAPNAPPGTAGPDHATPDDAGVSQVVPPPPDGAARLGAYLAPIWHWIAIAGLLGLWILLALNPVGGMSRVLFLLLGSAAIIVAARIVDNAACQALGRLVRPMAGPATEAVPHPLNGWLRAAIRLSIAMLAALALLQIWGVAALPWLFATELGRQILGGIGTIGITIVLAVIIWEGANLGINHRIARLVTGTQAARAARLRTLLPMLRTTLLISILIMVGLTVLSQLGVNIAPLLAGAGVLGIAIGFGSQKLVQDVITGLFLLLENVMQVGDVVTLGGQSGVVEELSVRSIHLRAEDGSVHVIPFSAVTTVTNMTRDFGMAVFEARVAIGEDYERVVRLLRDEFEAMRAEPLWATDISGDLDMQGLARMDDTAMVIKCRLRCGPFARWRVLREFQRRVQQSFVTADVALPMALRAPPAVAPTETAPVTPSTPVPPSTPVAPAR